MKAGILIIVILFTFIREIQSQYSQQWVAGYNGPDNFLDYAKSLTVDNSGNVYVTGTSFFESTFKDIVTIKYNSSGIQQWIRKFNSSDSSNDIPNSIINDNSGNIIVAGTSLRRFTGNDITIIKYNPAGDVIWTSEYNFNGNIIGQNDELCNVLISDNSGNIFIGGASQGFNTGYDYLLLKFNSDGNLIFAKRKTSPGKREDIIYDLKLDRQENIILTGEWGGSSGIDYLTVKYSPAGNEQWAAGYNGVISFSDIPKAICIDEHGNIYVTGTSFSSTIDDIVTLKYSPAGIRIWETSYDGPESTNDFPNAMTLDDHGNIYIAASSVGFTTFPEFTTLKYDTSGNLQWVRRYDHTGIGSGEATMILKDNQDNILVGGHISRAVSNLSLNDFVLMSYDSEGILKWTGKYNSTFNSEDFPSSMKTDNTGNIYVCGYSNMAAFNYDFATVKYSVVTSIKHEPVISKYQYLLYQNYPNPFNPSTSLQFEILDRGFVTIKVYNDNGNEVDELVNENKEPGNYNINFDGKSFPSGIYFYSLIVNENIIDTKKMILLK